MNRLLCIAQVSCLALPAGAWRPFAAWKRSRGKATTIVASDHVASSFEGPDHQKRIHRWTRHPIDHDDTRSVILGSDSQPDGTGVVPDRYSAHRTMWGGTTKTPADINHISSQNWDADGDGQQQIQSPSGRWNRDPEIGMSSFIPDPNHHRSPRPRANKHWNAQWSHVFGSSVGGPPMHG